MKKLKTIFSLDNQIKFFKLQLFAISCGVLMKNCLLGDGSSCATTALSILKSVGM